MLNEKNAIKAPSETSVTDAETLAPLSSSSPVFSLFNYISKRRENCKQSSLRRYNTS